LNYSPTVSSSSLPPSLTKDNGGAFSNLLFSPRARL